MARECGPPRWDRACLTIIRRFSFEFCAAVTWVAHTEFTLRPRFARTGVVGHDSWVYFPNTASVVVTLQYSPPRLARVMA